MKKISLLLASVLSAFAVDYSTMSLAELQAARGTVAEADRSAFQTEMQTRMQALTPEERTAAIASMRQSKLGTQDGTGMQMHQSKSGMQNSTGMQMHQGGGQGSMSGSTMGTKMQHRMGR